MTAVARPTDQPKVGTPQDLGQVAYFDVSATRVAYVVRQSDATFAVFSRNVSTDGKTIKLGTPHRISKLGENVESHASLALWGKHTAYVTLTKIIDNNVVDALAVVSPSGHKSFPNRANPASQLSGSGHTLVATRAPGGGVTAVNLKTNTTKHLLKSQRYVNTTMSHTGHDLAYGDDKGRVWRMDLNTGKRHLVFNGKVNYATDTFVSADASTTAWDITPANGGKGKIDGYRKIGRNAQPLSHHAYALSQYGPLLTDQAGGAFYDANHPVLLHTFGGGTAAVLPVGKYQQLPEIAGKVIGWISDDYHLQVASFRPAR